MDHKVDRFDNLQDLNTGLRALKADGRDVIDIKIFSFTQLTQEGLPTNVPVFYVHHKKGILVP